ncbi:MAG: hypothetical protein AVDCRST_MAG67-1416, partial [uncultured Solirubrobacteraceae bacterium]
VERGARRAPVALVWGSRTLLRRQPPLLSRSEIRSNEGSRVWL